MPGNQHVLFRGKKYIILQKHTSHYCEIKEERNPFHIELVHITDITFLNKREKNPTINSKYSETFVE
jgi:hypothetical protein